jgi:hypothetical protein
VISFINTGDGWMCPVFICHVCCTPVLSATTGIVFWNDYAGPVIVAHKGRCDILADPDSSMQSRELELFVDQLAHNSLPEGLF